VSLGIYPAIDPLQSSSTLLTPEVVGDDHFQIATQVKATIARYVELQDLIAILGMEELSETDQRTVIRARRIQRFMTQPFFSAEPYTGNKGVFVSLKDTLHGFKEILEGKYDNIPEQAFYMVGTIEDALLKAQQMAALNGEPNV